MPDNENLTLQKIVDQYFEQFKKKLDDKQRGILLAKKASENSLWLKIACEEMRVFGEFMVIENLIKQLPDSLPA